MDYTIELYKQDGRTKSGERFVRKMDITATSPKSAVLKHYQAAYSSYRVELHETYVTKKNMMTGKEFKQRYDTPYFCSPSSESFWSM